MPIHRLPCLLRCLLLCLLPLSVLTPSLSTTAAASQDRERLCDKIDRDIRRIEARMRRPYTAAQGVRFDERLRELKRRRYKYCK